jgi:hypothetical protein
MELVVYIFLNDKVSIKSGLLILKVIEYIKFMLFVLLDEVRD